ncbi:hypothetical protein Tco_0725791 [Tanacetum coccineum]|uniref:Uncharacterized protein n=1 Tax=Tanacetum coccineum TaxID=301880 RepID=A0ABQ4YG39_9ASTR
MGADGFWLSEDNFGSSCVHGFTNGEDMVICLGWMLRFWTITGGHDSYNGDQFFPSSHKLERRAIIMGVFKSWTYDETDLVVFNVSSARCFDRFIVSSGLEDRQLERLVSLNVLVRSVYSFEGSFVLILVDSFSACYQIWLMVGRVFDSWLEDNGGCLSLAFDSHATCIEFPTNMIEFIDKDFGKGKRFDDYLLIGMDLKRLQRAEPVFCEQEVDGLDRDSFRGTKLFRASRLELVAENMSPGPDGFVFEFFRTYWSLVGADFCDAGSSIFLSPGPKRRVEDYGIYRSKSTTVVVLRIERSSFLGTICALASKLNGCGLGVQVTWLADGPALSLSRFPLCLLFELDRMNCGLINVSFLRSRFFSPGVDLGFVGEMRVQWLKYQKLYDDLFSSGCSQRAGV